MTVSAMRAVLTDPALPQGAKALFSYYMEFSFVPASGGIRAGVILAPLNYTAEMLHANRDCVLSWRKQLITRGYIWTDKVKVPRQGGRPWCVVYISCLVPKSNQRGLFECPENGIFKLPVFGMFQPPESGSNQTPESGSNQTPESGSNQTPESGRLSKGVQDQRKGGATQPSSPGWQNPTNGRSEYVSEKKVRLQILEDNLRALTSKPENYRKVLKKSVADKISEIQGDIQRWKKSGTKADLEKAAGMERKVSDYLASPTSYESTSLVPGKAQEKSNLTRKIQALRLEIAS
jgi:hypothetical protein